MTEERKVEYPRGHAKIIGIFGRRKLEDTFLEKIQFSKYIFIIFNSQAVMYWF